MTFAQKLSCQPRADFKLAKTGRGKCANSFPDATSVHSLTLTRKIVPSASSLKRRLPMEPGGKSAPRSSRWLMLIQSVPGENFAGLTGVAGCRQ